jgi:general secretion pathway protein L
MQTIFQQAFPDVQRVQDPRAQMAARLRTLRDTGNRDADFADLLARAGGVLADGSGARLDGLTWRGGTLELEIAADDLQVLDRIQRGFADAGLSAELRGADRGEDGINGRLTVTAGGA